MGQVKIGINGMGRIGRTLLRQYLNDSNRLFSIAAVNSPGVLKEYAHLIKYDSVHGPLKEDVQIVGDDEIKIGDNPFKFYGYKDPAEIPWEKHDVDIVIDASGVFKDSESLGKHKRGSVKKVIMCAPGKNLDGTFVMGINHETYNNDTHHIVSNASCTTNCLAPVAKVLHEKFEIESGFMTTIHSYTSDQRILDTNHSDMRRARSAALSMIPTTTGAAKAVGLVIPELLGKLDGFAIRVPTPNVSLVDFNVTLKTNVTIEEVNNALIEASNGQLQGVLSCTHEELVSCDYNGMKDSSRVDLPMTNVIGGNNVKVVAWYDNETGFSNRVLDLAGHMGSKL